MTQRTTDEELNAAEHDAAMRDVFEVRRLWRNEARRARAEEERYRKRVERLEAALRPFAEFVKAFDAKPLRGIADEFYTIHSGTENEASLSLAQCRAALAALEAE